LLYFVLLITFRKDKKFLCILFFIGIITSLITSLWVLYNDIIAYSYKYNQFIIGIESKLEDWRGFLIAGFGNTSHIAGHIAYFVPITFLFYLNEKRKWLTSFYFFTLCVNYAAMIVCWSVASNAGLILGIVLIFILISIKFNIRFWIQKKVKLVLLLIAYLLITIIYITNNPLNTHSPSIFKQAFSSERWIFGKESRVVIWYNTIEMIRNSPLLGVGTGNYTYNYTLQKPEEIMKDKKLINFAGAYTNAAHNEFLQSWAETGILGIFILICIFLLFFKYSSVVFRETYDINEIIIIVSSIAAVAGFLIQSLMDYPLQLPSSIIMFLTFLSTPVILSKNYVPCLRIKLRGFIKTNHIAEFYAKLIFIKIVFLIIIFIILKPIISDTYYHKARIISNRFMKYGVKLSQDEIKQAEKYYENALIFDRNNTDCRSNYASFLLRIGDPKKAIEEFEIVKKRLRAYEIYLQQGDAYFTIGDVQEALKNWQMAYNIRPSIEEQFLSRLNISEKIKNKNF
jgi:O-antigen ligase